MPYRRPIFTSGDHVRAKTDFTCLSSSFRTGELLVFRCAGYVPYDNSFAYEFTSESGEQKMWMTNEADSVDAWKEFFEKVAQ